MAPELTGRVSEGVGGGMTRTFYRVYKDKTDFSTDNSSFRCTAPRVPRSTIPFGIRIERPDGHESSRDFAQKSCAKESSGSGGLQPAIRESIKSTRASARVDWKETSRRWTSFVQSL
jgi:hypothetical protein